MAIQFLLEGTIDFFKKTTRVLLSAIVVLALLFGGNPAFAYDSEAAVAYAEIHENGWHWPAGVSDPGGYLGWLAYNSAYSGYHLAQDFKSPTGTPVHALANGTILYSRSDVGGYGEGSSPGGALVALFRTSSGQQFKALYGHIDNPSPQGHAVIAGEIIGYINEYDPSHLHFGIHPGPTFASGENPWRGYTTDPSSAFGWTDPIAFLNSNSALFDVATPTISSVSPPQPQATDGRQNFTINGNNFDGSAFINLYDQAGDVYPLSGNRVLSRSATQIVVNPNFTSDGAGTWQVEVVNGSGQVSDLYPFPVIAVAAGPRILGIDVSSHITWSSVSKNGFSFAFIKATEGVDYTDKDFWRNMNEAADAGIPIGLYHFGRPVPNTSRAEEEAETFANVFNSARDQYTQTTFLKPALDIENYEYEGIQEFPYEMKKAPLSQWVRTWMQTVEDLTGIEPLLYVNSWYSGSDPGSWSFEEDITSYDLWVANYTSASSPNTGIWNDWAFWQYEQNQNMSGVGVVDLNRFNGDEAALQKFVIGGSVDEYPTVNTFDVEPDSITLGSSDSLTISYAVSDDIGLQQVELWRATDTDGDGQPNWPDKAERTTPLSGQESYTGSFNDAPSSPGTYWYGMHVLDNSGDPEHWNDEKNSKTGGVPGVFGPKQIEVLGAPLLPSIRAGRSSFDFGATQSSWDLPIWNHGGGVLAYDVAVMSGGSYFSVAPGSGSSVGIGDQVIHTVAVKRGNIVAGETVSGMLRISCDDADNNPQFVNLTAGSPGEGWRSPTATGKEDSDWTNPEYGYTSDDQWTIVQGQSLEQDYYNFNFNIPVNATINGIRIEVEGHGDGTGLGENRFMLNIWSESSIGGGNWAAKNNGSGGWWFVNSSEDDVIETGGGATDLWGYAWQASDFSNEHFKARIQTWSGIEKLYIDHIRARVYYTESPPTCVVSGYVRTSQGGSISDVALTGLPGDPATDSGGYYSAAVDNGWSGTVTPTKEGYTFDPASSVYMNVSSDMAGENYTGTTTVLTVEFATTNSTSSESVSPVEVPVTLSGPSGQTVTVNFSASGGTATGGGVDYTLPSGPLVFPPGETTRTIDITINNDALYEDAETVVVALSNPQNAQLGANTLYSYAIVNDDALPVVSFAQSASIGSESTSPIQLDVTLSPASGLAAKVDYAVTAGGTATGGGVDYTLTPGTLTFAPGETTKQVPITVVSDGSSEGDETVIVTLVGAKECSLGTITEHTYTIRDTALGTLHVDMDGDTAGIQATRSTAGISMGGDIKVQVWTKDVQDLKGITGSVTFDATCWECQEATEGPFLASAGGTTFFQGSIDNTFGTVSMDGAVLAPNASNSPDGDGVLATLTLKLLKKQENTIAVDAPVFVEVAGVGDSQYTPQVLPGAFVLGPESDFVGKGSASPDGYVDFWDLLYFADRWHTRSTDTLWDKRCDLDKNDDYVDFWDLLVFAEQWHTGEKP